MVVNARIDVLFSADPVDPGQVAPGAEAGSGGLRGRVWREGAVLAVCGSALGWFPGTGRAGCAGRPG